MSRKRRSKPFRGYLPQWVFFGDTHVGADGGLCPPSGFKRDSGVYVPQNLMQRVSWEAWVEAKKWLDVVLEGKPFGILHGGDAIDGMHHHATTLMSDNLNDQEQACVEILEPWFEHADCRLFTRGTEAHVGAAAQSDERIAKALGCEPDEYGRFARYESFIRMGHKDGPLVHDLHHIGTVGSPAYESSALMREYSNACDLAARSGRQAPDAIIRHHRHRQLILSIPGHRGKALVVTVAGWQMKDSAFVHRSAGARQSTPQLGLVVLKWNKDAGLYYREFLRFMDPPKEVGYVGGDK